MPAFKVAVIAGDGIGPEVMAEGLRTLSAAAKATSLDIETVKFSCGAARLKARGDPWDEGSYEFCETEADAIVFGAVGLPGVPNPKGKRGSVILSLRKGLDLYANVRPVRLLKGVPILVSGRGIDAWRPGDVDLVIVRENSEGLYHDKMLEVTEGKVPKKGEGKATGEKAVDTRCITKAASNRIIRFAFETACERGGAPSDRERSVTCVDKSNVLDGCKMFESVFHEVATSYPDVEARHAYIDAFQLEMLTRPGNVDVVVTTNLFGDIMSDLAAIMQGGLGMAPSANIGDRKGLFEPVHGSAPDIAGKGIANPTAMVLSVAMMLEWLGKARKDKRASKAAHIVREAVAGHYATMPGPEGLTPDLGGTARTKDLGDAFVERIKALTK